MDAGVGFEPTIPHDKSGVLTTTLSRNMEGGEPPLANDGNGRNFAVFGVSDGDFITNGEMVAGSKDRVRDKNRISEFTDAIVAMCRGRQVKLVTQNVIAVLVSIINTLNANEFHNLPNLSFIILLIIYAPLRNSE